MAQVTFTEEEKYIIKPFVDDAAENEKVGVNLLEYLKGYLATQESQETSADDIASELMEGIYEKLVDLDPEQLEEVIAGTDWNNCFEEI